MFKFNIGLKVAALLGVTALTVFVMVPRRVSTVLADSNLNCTSSTQPTFNPYNTVLDNAGGCVDYSFMRANVNGGGWTTGSIQAQAGDKVDVVLYIDNGAALNSAALTGMVLNTSASLGANTSHAVSASVTASNANNSLSGNLNIATADGSSLQVDSYTGEWFQYSSDMGSLGNVVNTSTSLPDQAACFPFVRFIHIVFDVVGQQVQPSQPQSFNLNVSNPPICANYGAPTFSVTNASSGLIGKQIYWSSTFNGQSTGENKDGYSQYINNSGSWSGVGSVFNSNQVGSWTKTASFVDGNGNVIASQTVSFTVLPTNDPSCGGTTPPPASYGFNLSITPNQVCVNTQSSVAITNAISNLNGKQVFWSSTLNGQNTGENLSGYNQFINNGSYSGQTSTWTASEVGSWTKTASFVDANGNVIASQTTGFTVLPLSNSACGGTPPVQTYTATASATVSATASASCANGTSATASASASASATATSSVSQQDAQNQAQSKANAQAQAQANAQAQASASAQCPSTPVTPVCTSNGNFALNASTPAKNGGSYAVTLTWTSTGSHQIKITQINPGTSVENTTIIGNANGNQTITGLLAGSTYIFKMYDVACGQFLSSVQVTTPANAGQLVCSVANSTINSGSQANFSATGGTAPYNWSGDGSPSTGSGSTYNPVYTNTGTSSLNHNVTVTSSDGQTANCGVVVSAAPQQTTSGGNCNNDSSSCNNNTNTNNSSNGSGNNNSNQNNNNNINGNNNTTTNTNNNCVNNSCNTTNTVYINGSGSVVPANQFSQLSITKGVRSLYSNNNYNNNYNGSFANSTNANNGDTVQFQIVVTNTGSATANNVRLTDNLPGGLNLVSGSVTSNGGYSNGNNFYGSMNLGSLSAGQSVTVTFSATVSGGVSASIQNIATASSDNAGSVQASAWVFVNSGSVQGGNVNLTYSKSAFNNTKNQNATAITASNEDYITYTLTVLNSGNTPANNFVITDDLSQVLPYADIADYGGGSLSGNVITFPGITVPANGSITRSFEVRVKFGLASNLSYVMTNTYGNVVTIRINTPQVLGAFTAPKTGADTNAFAFAGLLTAGFAVYKKKNVVMKLIFS